MGNYMKSKEGVEASNVFYELAFGKEPYYKHQGWISGRITTDDNFTFYAKPQLEEQESMVPGGNYISNQNKGMYYISIDPSGKLGWKNNELVYGDTHAHVIEIITEQASNSYKAMLRKLDISYIIAGKKEI